MLPPAPLTGPTAGGRHPASTTAGMRFINGPSSLDIFTRTVQFSCSVGSLRPHELRHTRLPCPSPTPRACLNSCLCHPLFLPLSIFPSIRVFSSESVLCIRWPKYWSFSLSISPSSEHSGPISFRIDWLDLLAVQGTLKSLLQHHSSKTSILRHSAFFIVQLSHP